MVRYSITDESDHVHVEIEGYEGPRLPLLEAFRVCQRGRCSCPTDEAEHLEILEVDEVDGCIELDLTPRAGSKIHPATVRRCLEETFARFADPARR